MLKQHARLIAMFLYVTDMVVTALSFFFAYWIRSNYLTELELRRLYPIEKYLWLFLVIIPVWSFLFFYYKSYKSYRIVSFMKELQILWKVVLIGGLVIGAMAFAFQSYYLSRTLIVMFVAVNLVLLIVERFSIRTFSRFVRKRGYNYRNIIIVGTDNRARDLAVVIGKYKHWGLRVLGFVADNPANTHSEIDGHRIIGNVNEMQKIINKEIVDEVIFAVPRGRFEQLEDIFLMLEENGINAAVVANFFPHAVAKAHLEELENIPLLTFTTTPTNTFALAFKRLFDIVSSVLLLILLLPVIVITALLIKATSPGYVFFRQKRCGLNGRVFTLYKFRSMVTDAEAKREKLEALNEMEGPAFKIKNDPRVTRIGHFIRKSSIDELPQLWNVLKGDMSIVGPRPPLPEEVSKYKRWQRRRLSMRPGLTCLWQISGRNIVKDFDNWAKLDLQYIDTWSLMLDMKIFLKTIPVVLFRIGAA